MGLLMSKEVPCEWFAEAVAMEYIDMTFCR
jgi:hypothetical protein